MEILLITPRDDRAARRSAQWAERLAAKFPFLSVSVVRSRRQVDALLAEHRHLFYFGHGERDALVLGPKLFRGRTALVDVENVGTLQPRVVVAVACWSGEELARSAIRPDLTPAPIESYLGWLDEVGWPSDWSEPIDDAVVKGLSVLLDGGSVGDCVSALEAAFEEAHERYRANTNDRLPPDRAALGKMYATYWRARIAAEGNLNATL
jgi:hypothetical protein